MNQLRFTIIIPTRERADTLLHTLRTCVGQPYENLRILVSDNASTDGTREVVESFRDDRLQYINPGKRLNMSHHWEFALEHVRDDGYVTVLGDDDGLLPDSVNETNTIIAETGAKAVHMNPDPDAYFWPGYTNPKHANLLKVSFDKGVNIVQAAGELRRVMQCKAAYDALPSLYNSFVDMRVIRDVRKRTGRIFLSRIPDVYTGVAFANSIEWFANSRRRLRLTGASSHSTGASQFGKDQTAANKFLQEENIPFHPAVGYCHSFSYLLAESYLQSFDGGLNAKESEAFDFMPFIQTAVKEANGKLSHQRDSIIQATQHIAAYNQLDRDAVARIVNGPQSKWRNLIGYDAKKYLHPFMLFDASVYGVTNIYDACQLHRDIHNNPMRYLTKRSTWLNLKRLL